MKSNKFNISWQVVRVEARKIKDPQAKINLALEHLDNYPTIHTYDRVHNWLSMTKLGYFGERLHIRGLFDEAIATMVERKDEIESTLEDLAPANLEEFEDSQVLAVYKDLAKRTYGFRIKTIPKAHTAYLEELEEYLGKKGLI